MGCTFRIRIPESLEFDLSAGSGFQGVFQAEEKESVDLDVGRRKDVLAVIGVQASSLFLCSITHEHVNLNSRHGLSFIAQTKFLHPPFSLFFSTADWFHHRLQEP
jgi:hypothetical protein